jgi:tripartite-type tricarboxylate transporter receptor subunit TctC
MFSMQSQWPCRRSFSAISSVIFSVAFANPLVGNAQTDTYPSRPIFIIVPTAPGSTGDLLARLLSPVMSKSMGVPVFVENKAGAASAIGASTVARANPDGYTILIAPPPVLSVNQWLYKKLPYQPEKDFTPIVAVASTPNVLVVHPSVPVKNLSELLALAKAKPQLLTYASGGSGTTAHLCGELIRMNTGISITHVPYKSPAPALQDVLSGQVLMMCENLSNAVVHIRSGSLRPIALTAMQRHAQAPEIPTAHESGIPNFEVGVWFGFVAPAATPTSIVRRLNKEIAFALKEASVAQKLESLGLSNLADTPESFGKFIASESIKWRKVVEISGAQVD